MNDIERAQRKKVIESMDFSVLQRGGSLTFNKESGVYESDLAEAPRLKERDKLNAARSKSLLDAKARL